MPIVSATRENLALVYMCLIFRTIKFTWQRVLVTSHDCSIASCRTMDTIIWIFLSCLPLGYFLAIKIYEDAVKVLHSICQQIWKTQQWPRDWKRSVFILVPKKGNAKECSNCCTIALISHNFEQAQNSPSQASTIREL